MAVTWSNAARHDVARIFDFNVAYDLDRAVMIDGAERCSRNPTIGRPVGDTTIRERSLTDIQYVIRCRIDGEIEITILGVRHTRENRICG